MRARCNNPNHQAYERYGGRGIAVDPKWMHSFEAFLKDMGKAPSSKHSIDRRDNDGNYTPDNCRWADKSTQQFNRKLAKNNSSGAVGVTAHGERWRACLVFRGVTYIDRCFDSFDEAVKARAAEAAVVSVIIEAETLLFGDQKCL